MKTDEISPGGSGATELARTFMEITSAIANGEETIDVFSRLTLKCVELLPVAAAGILLRDADGILRVIGASNPSAHLLDLFQVQNEEGPCLECLATGEPIADTDLDAAGRWPRFAALARAHDFSAVYALPLHSHQVAVGALNLFAHTTLGDDRLVVAQSLADAATLSLLHVDARLDASLVVQRIRMAVEARNTLDQARGMLAQRFSIDGDAALVRLQEVARETELSLREVATAVVLRDQDSPAFIYLAD